jgi:putative addiction module killer protein
MSPGREPEGILQLAQNQRRKQIEHQRLVSYSSHTIEVRQTTIFKEWLDGLVDQRAATRIAQRIVRLQAGLLGDVKPVGSGVSELRIDHGPGYRVYFIQRAQILIILLCGGDKRSQRRDTALARTLAAELEVE